MPEINPRAKVTARKRSNSNGAKHSSPASFRCAGGPLKGNLQKSNARRPKFVTLLGQGVER